MAHASKDPGADCKGKLVGNGGAEGEWGRTAQRLGGGRGKCRGFRVGKP